MAGRLSEYLRAAAGQPFVWGERDCALWAAEWIGLVRGIAHPAAHLKGRYRTRLGCMRLLKREGGLLAVAKAIASGIGLESISEPQAGDVACVEYRHVTVLAIRTQRGFAMKTMQGVAIDQARLIAAWKI